MLQLFILDYIFASLPDSYYQCSLVDVDMSYVKFMYCTRKTARIKNYHQKLFLLSKPFHPWKLENLNILNYELFGNIGKGYENLFQNVSFT